MYNDTQQASQPQTFSKVSTGTSGGGRLESIAYYFFLCAVILAPIIFWASPYLPQDIIKTFIIVLGTLVATILFGYISVKERKITLPPKSITWLSVLTVISLIISAYSSIQASKSLFGQGFELGTVSFIVLMFVAALVAFTVVSRRPDRAIVIYVGMVVAYVVLYIFQLLRMIFGPSFMSLAVFSSVTSSLIGGWYNVGTFAAVIAIVSLLAIVLLPLSKRMKITYWILSILSILCMVIVNDFRLWLVTALVFLGLTVYFFIKNGSSAGTFFKRIAWIPLIVFLISALFFYKGASIAGSTITKFNAGYSELSLPWQMTLDVTASAIKNYPMFGVGPNHFAQAFLAYKPNGINSTNVWGTEFSNGFGLLPTFVSTQGVVGSILWILFLIFFGVLGAKVLSRLPESNHTKFLLLSSYSSAVLLWLIAIMTVPSHSIIFYTFIFTGIFFGIATSSGLLNYKIIAPQQGSKMYKVFPIVMSILVLVTVVWGLVYMKKIAAFSYFAGGVKQLTVSGNAVAADNAFAKANTLDESDIYWQARAEAVLSQAKQVAATITSTTTAADSEKIAKQIGELLNKAISHTQKAIAYDKTNYYNYLSEARVSEAASGIKMANAYENAVNAYTSAANLNPYNPSIYLSLASFQANNNKLDDSLKTLGAALQVKNNYLDAVFLLSQVYAAKGDLSNAIVAAKVATQLNPQNSLLFFQLGILDYNNKDYAGAAEALSQAIKIQPDYANAKYFLGLSLVRIGNLAGAVSQFEDLAKTNPDNQEVSLILTNLKAGKPIFNDAKPPVTTAPEKRSKLPIKER